MKMNEYSSIPMIKCFIKKPIITDLETKQRITVGMDILSYKAFIQDAKKRNSTFLGILKEGLREGAEEK